VGDLYVYPLDLLERFLMFLKSNLIDKRAIVPPSVTEMLKKKGYLFNHMQMMMRKNPPIRKKENGDEPNGGNGGNGQPDQPEKPVKPQKIESEITIARAHFLVEDFNKVKEILTGSNLFAARETSDGKLEYTWSKTPARNLTGEEDGVVILGKSKLILTTASPDALEDGKSSINKTLKPYVKYMYDDVEKRRVTG
jgi:hypothetical protein